MHPKEQILAEVNSWPEACAIYRFSVLEMLLTTPSVCLGS